MKILSNLIVAILNILSSGLWSVRKTWFFLGDNNSDSGLNKIILILGFFSLLCMQLLIQFKLPFNWIGVSILHILLSLIPYFVFKKLEQSDENFKSKDNFPPLFKRGKILSGLSYNVKRILKSFYKWFKALSPWCFIVVVVWFILKDTSSVKVEELTLEIFKYSLIITSIYSLIFSFLDIRTRKISVSYINKKLVFLSAFIVSTILIGLFYFKGIHYFNEAFMGIKFSQALSWYEYKFNKTYTDILLYLSYFAYGIFFYISVNYNALSLTTPFKIIKRVSFLFLLFLMLSFSMAMHTHIGADFRLKQMDQIKTKSLSEGLLKKKEFLNYLTTRLPNNSIISELDRESSFMEYLLENTIPNNKFPRAIPNGFSLDIDKSWYAIFKAIQETNKELRKQVELNSRVLKLTNKGKLEVPYLEDELDLIQSFNQMGVSWGMDLYVARLFEASSKKIPILKDNNRWIAVMRKLDGRDSYLVYDTYYSSKDKKTDRIKKVDIPVITEWSQGAIENLIIKNKGYYFYVGKIDNKINHDIAFNMMMGDMWQKDGKDYQRAIEYYKKLDEISLINPRKDYIGILECYKNYDNSENPKFASCLNTQLEKSNLKDLPWKMKYDILYKNWNIDYPKSRYSLNNIKLIKMIIEQNDDNSWYEMLAFLYKSLGSEEEALAALVKIYKYDDILPLLVKLGYLNEAKDLYYSRKNELSTEVKNNWISYLNILDSTENIDCLKKAILQEPYQIFHYQKLINKYSDNLSKREKYFYKRWFNRLNLEESEHD